MNNPPRVAVGIALYGYVPAFVYWRHLGWIVESAARGEMQGLLGSENCYLPWARRDIVRDALKGNFTHLFFLDEDVIVPPRTITRLLETRKPIVGALYYQKVSGHAPVAGYLKANGDGWEPIPQVKSGLMRVDVIGMGATLIETTVFRALGGEEDWFDMNAKTGEDIEFCRRAREKGFSIYVDPGIETYHVGGTPIGRSYYDPRLLDPEPQVEILKGGHQR